MNDKNDLDSAQPPGNSDINIQQISVAEKQNKIVENTLYLKGKKITDIIATVLLVLGSFDVIAVLIQHNTFFVIALILRLFVIYCFQRGIKWAKNILALILIWLSIAPFVFYCSCDLKLVNIIIMALICIFYFAMAVYLIASKSIKAYFNK